MTKTMVQSETPAPGDPSIHCRNLFAAMTTVVLICWIFVTYISRQPGHWAVLQFLLAAAIIMVATAAVVWRYHHLRQSIPVIWIVATAILLRFISVFGEPLFEDDYYRYLWDGYQTITTLDPYSLAPAVFFDDESVPEVFEPVLSLINYPEIATVYGPVTQWIFSIGYLVQAAEVWPLQMLAGLADLLVLILLYKLGARNALLFYAWSPLLLKEFSLTAHPDIYAILAVVISIFAAARNYVWLAGLSLALGVGAKVFAVLALPFLLSQRWSLRYWSTLVGWFLITIVLLTLPFGTIKIWAPEGLQAMADSWLFNSAVYLMFLQVLSFQSIKLVLLAVFCSCVIAVCTKRVWSARQSIDNQPVPYDPVDTAIGWQASSGGFRGDWLFMLFLLALPVVNSWYVAWILPFATLYPRWWSWAFSYCCLVSYWTGANTGAVGAGSLVLPTWIIALEYTTVAAIAVLAWVFFRHKLHYRPFAGL